MDAILADGLLKEIPIVSSMTAVIKLGAQIQHQLLLKKLLTFLHSLKDVPADQRKNMIDDIDKSKKHRIKVGEKLMYIIDAADDYEMSELVGLLFKSFVKGKITYEDFLKSSSVLHQMNISDFKWFTTTRRLYRFNIDDAGHLIGSGLFHITYEDIDVDVYDQEDQPATYDGKRRMPKLDASVSGGMDLKLSRAGEVLLQVFAPGYEEYRKRMKTPPLTEKELDTLKKSSKRTP